MNDYIRVANPSVWMILIAVIVLAVRLYEMLADTENVTGGIGYTDKCARISSAECGKHA